MLIHERVLLILSLGTLIGTRFIFTFATKQ